MMLQGSDASVTMLIHRLEKTTTRLESIWSSKKGLEHGLELLLDNKDRERR